MCKVYNQVGELTTIKEHLRRNGISGFTSVNELIAFQKNYSTAREEITANQRVLIIKERDDLGSLIQQLENEINIEKQAIRNKLRSEIDQLQQQLDVIADTEKTFIQEFTLSFKAAYLAIKVKYKELTFDSIVSSYGKEKIELLGIKRSRYQYIVSDIDRATRESAFNTLFELDKKKRVIDEVNTSIYGAIGEQKVANELKQLSDDFILINDFRYSFDKPLYYPDEKQYIKSIQIDHLIISTAGILIIETKNWSRDSIQNTERRSPVAQINRTGYAMYKLAANFSNSNLWHHWGKRKIPITKIIVLIEHKPMEKFQHVTVLTLNKLVGHIERFEPSLSKPEVNKISDWLVKVGR